MLLNKLARRVMPNRHFSTLVLAEHLEGKLNSNIGSCLTAANQLNDKTVDVLIHGSATSVALQLEQVNKYTGINKVFTATNDHLENAYGQSIASIASSLIKANGYSQVVSSTSSFGKDVIPRIGGLLDLQPITDVTEIKDNGTKFVRPIYAGNAMCTVSTTDNIKLITVRSTNFDKQP